MAIAALDVVGHPDAATALGGDLFGGAHPLGRGLVGGRGGVDEVHPELNGDEHRRATYVGAVTDEHDRAVLQALAWRQMLEHGEYVADRLRRVVEVAQPVDHRNIGVTGETRDGGVFKRARFDHVAHTREHFRGVVQGLASPEVDFARLQVEGMTAEFGHRHFERDARPCRRFFEDHRQRPAAQQLRYSAVAIGRFEQGDQLEELP